MRWAAHNLNRILRSQLTQKFRSLRCGGAIAGNFRCERLTVEGVPISGNASMVTLLGEPAFDIDGGLAARAGGSDGLAIIGIRDITRGEDALHAGVGAERLLQDDVLLLVQFHLPAEEVGVRGVANSEEDASSSNCLGGAVD